MTELQMHACSNKQAKDHTVYPDCIGEPKKIGENKNVEEHVV